MSTPSARDAVDTRRKRDYTPEDARRLVAVLAKPATVTAEPFREWLASELKWDEPDAGCVTCGQPYVTVSDHRCGECLDGAVRHCPHCLEDISSLIDRETVRRLRSASGDVNAAWTEGKHLERLATRQRVEKARRDWQAGIA